MSSQLVVSDAECEALGSAGIPPQVPFARAARGRKRARQDWGAVSGDRYAAAVVAGRISCAEASVNPPSWPRERRIRILAAAYALTNPHVVHLTSASKFGADWAIYPGPVEESHASNLIFAASLGTDGTLRSLAGTPLRGRDLVPLVRISGQAFKDALLIAVPDRAHDAPAEGLDALRAALRGTKALALRYHRPLSRGTGTSARKAARRTHSSAPAPPPAAAEAEQGGSGEATA